MKPLQKWCESKSGVIAKRNLIKAHLNRNVDEDKDYHVLNGFLDHFASFYYRETNHVVMLRLSEKTMSIVNAQYGGITNSQEMRWETVDWTWVDVPLNANIPQHVLESLIDESYDILVNSMSQAKKDYLGLIAKDLTPEELFDELIEYYKLAPYRDQIAGLARKTLIFKTTPSYEEEIPIGQTKIGGSPDLPLDISWPCYTNGKPLGFQAQINLAEIDSEFKGPLLPESGILYFFSVFGWQDSDDADPNVPKGKYNFNWTRVIYVDTGKRTLTRLKTPDGTKQFKASAVCFVPTITFPNDKKEPALVALDAKRPAKSRIVELAATYHAAIQFKLGNPNRNLLLGFTEFQQDFVKDIAAHNLILLFQLSSDGNSEMCWGDAGNLYFWISREDLQNLNFSNIYADYQGG